MTINNKYKNKLYLIIFKQMSNSSRYIFLSLIILFNYYSNCLYILPLNTTYEDWEKDELVSKNFFYNKIFTELKIGDPSDTLPTFIKSGDYCSYIAFYTSKIKTNYDATKSETFKSLTDYNLVYKDFNNSCLANERISLSTNLNNYKSDLTNVNFSKFYYAPNNTKSQEMPYLSGVFGFKLQKEQNEECQSFIENFGENEKDRLVSIEYSEDEEDNSRIVIGEYPHVYDKNLYSEDNFIKIFMNDSAVKTKGDYHLLFKEAYFYEENMIGSSRKISINDANLLESNFIFEQNMFTVPEEFFISYVVDFFAKYGSSCNITTIDNRYISYVCHKKSISNADIYAHFPTIFLEHKEANFTFEFTYEELLKEKNEKLYLMMALDTLNENMWGLGKIFMEKYLCTFNSKEKSVGIYTKRNENSEDYSFDFLDSGIYVILILGGNILVVVGCIMYALISKCTKSSVDPTIMIESFSGTVDDLKKTLKEDNINTGNKPKKEIEITEA